MNVVPLQPHVSIEQLLEFQEGELPPNEILALSRHLAQCAECASLARSMAGEHPRSTNDAVAKPHPYFWLAVAAALIVAIVSGVLVVLHRKAPPERRLPRTIATTTQAPGYGRADWDAVTRTATLPLPPVLAQLRPSSDPLRGSADPTHISLDPRGVAIETTAPRFTWPAEEGAHYVVSIFEGRRLVAESPLLAAHSWTPSTPLARGANYTWQVEARRGDNVTVLPAPPARPPMFRVVDAATLRDLDEARSRFPNDHLLLGVLYARAGMQREAEEELGQSTDPRAARLLRDVRNWHP